MNPTNIQSPLEDITRLMDTLWEQVRFDEHEAVQRLTDPNLVRSILGKLEESKAPKERYKSKKILDILLSQLKEYETLYGIEVDQSIKNQLRDYRVYVHIK